MAKNKFTIGGLCSGVGGIELGFQQAGFKIAWANDLDKNCMVTYEAIMGENHYRNKKAKSIDSIVNGKMTPKSVTVLAAGFPCQAFSIAGERKGFDDARGTVIYDIIALISKFETDKKPKVLFLENVKNFKTHDDGNTYDTIVKKLNELNYSVYTKVLNSCDYSDVPQNRERTYMVCFLGEGEWNKKLGLEKSSSGSMDKKIKKHEKDFPITTKFHLHFPDKNEQRTTLINVNLNDFFDEEVDDKYYYNNKNYKQYYDQLTSEIENPSETSVYQIRRVYIRQNKNNLCPTLTANMGTGGHNVPLIYNSTKKKWRKLTPKECFRIQGYGEEYVKRLPDNGKVSNGQLYKQAGNSVSVGVIEKLAKSIKIALEI